MRSNAWLVVLSGFAASLIASKLLLMAGMTSVVLRYPMAAMSACGAFAMLGSFWISNVRGPAEPVSDAPPQQGIDADWLDILDLEEIGLEILLIIGVLIFIARMSRILRESVSVEAMRRRMRFPMAAMLTISIAMGQGVHYRCPQAHRLADLARPTCIQSLHSSIISNGAQKQ